MKNIKFLSLKGLSRASLLESPLVSLGNSIELPALIRRVGFRIIPIAFPRKVKFSSRLKQLSNLVPILLRIRKNHGSMYVIKYLKACQLALQKSIAGHPFSTLREIEPDLPLRRLSNGLPAIIPKYDREAIRAGRPSVIRWWNTIFSLYRVLQVPGTMKLGTITDPFCGDPVATAKIGSVISKVFDSHLRRTFKVPRIKGCDAKLLFLEASSPTSRVS